MCIKKQSEEKKTECRKYKKTSKYKQRTTKLELIFEPGVKRQEAKRESNALIVPKMQQPGNGGQKMSNSAGRPECKGDTKVCAETTNSYDQADATM